jgi:leucyl-tRNA synthetase
MAETKEKTGVFIGAFAINPVNAEEIPVYLADYVLMGYGTGAIMAVPAHDERDFEFAKKFKLPIRAVVMPPDEWLKEQILAFSQEKLAHEPAEIRVSATQVIRLADLDDEMRAKVLEAHYAAARSVPDQILSMGEEGLAPLREDYKRNPANFPTAFTGSGVAINSKARMIDKLEAEETGHRAITFKLRDWLFSRQRYWGEPFPILLDEEGNAYAVDESELPVTLPPMTDFKPTGTPEPPLSKMKDWVIVQRDGRTFYRETNTMPQWAGSCWYYLRFIDPHNDKRFVDSEKERYWMPVDLYVGGVEHAVLHLLYSRFWHKVLYDLGHVSSPEPFQRLINQGLILGETEFHTFETSTGVQVSATEVRELVEEASPEGVKLFGIHKQTGEKLAGRRLTESDVAHSEGTHRLVANAAIRVDARSFKMSKSRGNVVNPDEIVADYGADTFRLYEMYMGPLEAQKPWNTRDIVGMSRFLNAVWRNLIGDDEAPNPTSRVTDSPIPEELERQMHHTIKKVGEDIAALRFNTAIAELIKLNNEMTRLPTISKLLAETFTLMLAPLAPHISEEIWQRLGHEPSISHHPWPKFDEAKLVEDTMELPVQVNGKVRDKIVVPADASEADILHTATLAPGVQQWITGKSIKKQIYVPKKLVNLVVG